MSFITLGRAVVPSVWPNDLGRVQARTKDLQVTDSWRFVPEDVDALCDWAKVVDDESGEGEARRLKHLVYRDEVLPSPGNGTLYTVSVILQGFLGHHALGTLGNWKGRERDAAYAIQHLTLESGGLDEGFRAQLNALDNLRTLIQMQVGGRLERSAPGTSSLMLKRPVFTKVLSPEAGAPSITLDDGNDPHHAARKLASTWRVDHVVETCVRRPNGSNLSVEAEHLAKGDFVEVTVTAHIQTSHGRNGRRVSVDFWLHEVVRLWQAKEAKVRRVPVVAGGAATDGQGTTSRVRTGPVGDLDVEMANAQASGA